MSKGLGKIQERILITLYKDGGTMPRGMLYFTMQHEQYGNAILSTNDDLEFNAMDKYSNIYKIDNASDELNRRRASISRAITLLEKRGMIKRVKLIETVEITDKGYEYLHSNNADVLTNDPISQLEQKMMELINNKNKPSPDVTR